MSIKPIAAARLYQRIAGEIVRLIETGTFTSGQRLPAERELALLLKVSRSSLREALSALELQGRLSIKVGAGTFVKSLRQHEKKTMAPAPREISPFDVLRARRLVEGEAAALAARNATASHIAGMQSAFKRLAADMRANRMQSAADREFHLCIARASGNTALSLVIERLWDEGNQPLNARIEKLYVSAIRKRDNVAEHQAVLDAIRGRDAAAARRAMRAHLANAERQRLGLLRGSA